jgi:hypothetical protein
MHYTFKPMYYIYLFFTKRITDLLIIINSSTKNTQSNKNYKKIFGPPSGDYEHWNEPKTRRRPRLSITGAGRSLSKYSLLVDRQKIVVLRPQRTNAAEQQPKPVMRIVHQKSQTYNHTYEHQDGPDARRSAIYKTRALHWY